MADETSETSATLSSSNPDSDATSRGQQTGSDATSETHDGKGATPDTSLGSAGREALEKERAARRDAARALADAQKRIAELEDAGKSDVERREARLQRAQLELEQKDKRIAELESEIEQRDLDALKREVAAEAGLPPSVAKRLEGKDLRSLKRDAEALATELNAGVPVGQIGVGRGGSASGRRVPDMNQMIREAAGR